MRMTSNNQDHRLRLYLTQEARNCLEHLKETNNKSASQIITEILLKMTNIGMENINELQQASKRL